MNALRTILLLVLASPLAARANSYVPADVKEYLQGAQVIAHVEITSNVPEKVFPSDDFACGATVTARVIESFKGAKTGSTITFAGGLAVGSQYLVALYKLDPDERGSMIMLPDDMSLEEAEKMNVACRKRLPDVESKWRVTSEFVSPKWVSWGYRIKLPAKDAGLTFIGRKTQNTIESLSYDGDDLAIAKTESVSADHPEYGPLVASTFSFPQLYVEWATYRNFLWKAFK